MKIKLSIFVIFLFFLTLLFFIFLNKNKIVYKISEYNSQVNIYVDRDYVNKTRSKFLINSLVLQVPRHNNKKIIFLSIFPVTIYRATCSLNNNVLYYNNWQLSKFNVNIIGITCTHTKVYYKKFFSPLIILDSGGPIASDPIFIKSDNKKNKIIVLNKRKQRKS